MRIRSRRNTGRKDEQDDASTSACHSARREFSSLKTRLSSANYYNQNYMLDALISRALGEKRVRDNTEVPSNPKIFPVLSRLTNVPELDLYSLTPHALAKLLVLPSEHLQITQFGNGAEVPLIERDALRKLLVPRHMARYCPACLKMGPRCHRLKWSLECYDTCPQHGCLLLTRCHTCGSELSIADVARGKCTRCYASLRNAPVVRLNSGDFALTVCAELERWVELKGLCGPMVGLPAADPSALYYLVTDIVDYLRSNDVPTFAHETAIDLPNDLTPV